MNHLVDIGYYCPALCGDYHMDCGKDSSHKDSTGKQHEEKVAPNQDSTNNNDGRASSTVRTMMEMRRRHLRQLRRSSSARLSRDRTTREICFSVARISSFAALAIVFYSNANELLIGAGATLFGFGLVHSLQDSLSAIRQEQISFAEQSQQLKFEALLAKNEFGVLSKNVHEYTEVRFSRNRNRNRRAPSAATSTNFSKGKRDACTVRLNLDIDVPTL